MADPLRIGDVPWISLRAANLKCFRETQGFERIEPINVIIGRNNSGKSTLLDLVQYAVEGPKEMKGKLSNEMPEVTFSCPLTDKIVERYGKGMSFNHLGSFDVIAKRFLGNVEVTWSPTEAVTDRCVKNIIGDDGIRSTPHGILDARSGTQVLAHFAKNFYNPFDKHRFNRILADWDITAESIETKPADELQVLQPNGENATRLITRYLNDANLDRSIVENKILKELNSIFRPDASFLRIVPLRREGGEWEIFLEEPMKGPVPLSRAGSGIKTVLLVLLHLYLVPDVQNRSRGQGCTLSDFLFGFEELENNLHPSLQRRLFLHLRNVAEREGCRFFITTHSHVVIDLFSRDKKAQIIHVAHDGESATATRISTYVGHRHIFHDLDVRASDLLQANAVVWVEGPSDRIYFNKWVELWSEGQLQEHLDYVVAFTAGTLLSHYSFDAPEAEQERVEALRINGNAIILIDSDKQDGDTELKTRVERVIKEIESKNGLGWVTAGKEVENYIPADALGTLLEDASLEPPSQYANVFEFVKDHDGGDFSKRKVELAERICESLTRTMLSDHLDLAEKLNLVCKRLRVWNSRVEQNA